MCMIYKEHMSPANEVVSIEQRVPDRIKCIL